MPIDERLKEEVKSKWWSVMDHIGDEKIAPQRKLADLLLVISVRREEELSTNQ